MSTDINTLLSLLASGDINALLSLVSSDDAGSSTSPQTRSQSAAKDLPKSHYDGIVDALLNKVFIDFLQLISGDFSQSVCQKIMDLICQHGDSTFCQMMLDQHKHCDVDYDLCIYDAATAGNLPVLQTLVKNGVDIHKDGATALWWACYNGHFDVVVYLVTNGVDPNSRTDILYAASINSHKQIVDYLTPLLV